MLFFLYNFLKVVGKFKVLSWKKKGTASGVGPEHPGTSA
jgi:hypothetical protein